MSRTAALVRNKKGPEKRAGTRLTRAERFFSPSSNRLGPNRELQTLVPVSASPLRRERFARLPRFPPDCASAESICPLLCKVHSAD